MRKLNPLHGFVAPLSSDSGYTGAIKVTYCYYLSSVPYRHKLLSPPVSVVSFGLIVPDVPVTIPTCNINTIPVNQKCATVAIICLSVSDLYLCSKCTVYCCSCIVSSSYRLVLLLFYV